MKLAPGPQGQQVFKLLKTRREDPFKLYRDLNREYGDIVRFKVGQIYFHLINDPDYVKHVLMDNHWNYSKGPAFERIAAVLGRGLVTNEGESWKKQRKLIQPTFNREHILDFFRTMTEIMEQALPDWEKLAAGGEQVDLFDQMMRLTLRMAGRTLLGSDVTQHEEKVGHSLTEVLRGLEKRQVSVTRLLELLPKVGKLEWTKNLANKIPTEINRRFNRGVANLDEVVFGIIDSRMKDGPLPGSKDLLSLLVQIQDEQSGEKMDKQQLRDEIMTFFLAGHETTATALAWTWYLLSQNPETARKVRAEVEAALGDRVPEYEDLQKLSYTRKVFDESLRLYPPIWRLTRQAKEADKVGGYDIPPRSIMLMVPFMLHRHPGSWQNPEIFDPENFNPDRASARPRFAYMPFGGGPRQCIGNHFASMEAMVILSMMIRKVRFDLVSGHSIGLEPQLTLRPRNGILAHVHPAAAQGGKS